MMEKRDRLIPYYFVIAFAIVFMVNGIFVYLAVTSFSGVVSENAYVKGLNYDDVIGAVHEQKKLGWSMDLAYEGGAFVANFRGRDGQPLQGVHIIATISRPVGERHQQQFTLAEVGAGRYSHGITLPLKGQWDVLIEASWNKNKYQSKQRLVIE